MGAKHFYFVTYQCKTCIRHSIWRISGTPLVDWADKCIKVEITLKKKKKAGPIQAAFHGKSQKSVPTSLMSAQPQDSMIASQASGCSFSQ